MIKKVNGSYLTYGEKMDLHVFHEDAVKGERKIFLSSEIHKEKSSIQVGCV